MYDEVSGGTAKQYFASFRKPLALLVRVNFLQPGHRRFERRRAPGDCSWLLAETNEAVRLDLQFIAILAWG